MDSCSSFQCLKHHCSDSHMETWWERKMLANCGRVAAYSIACTYYHFVSWRSTDVTQSLPGTTWTSQKIIKNYNISATYRWILTSLWNCWVIWCESPNSAFEPNYCSFGTGPVPQTHSFTSQHVWSLVKERGSTQAKYKWVIWKGEATRK